MEDNKEELNVDEKIKKLIQIIEEAEKNLQEDDIKRVLSKDNN